MSFPRRLKDLCTPAAVYFILSMISLAVVFLQNIGNNGMYSVGHFSCRVPSTIMVFIVKVLYILFWTWILNLICKDGYTNIAWFMVLLPFILLFIIIGMIMINQ